MAADTQISMEWNQLRGLLAELCPVHGLDLAGAVALPCRLPHAERFRDWLQQDRHGGLDYMLRDPGARLDPTRRDPAAGTLLVFGQGYTRGWPADDPDPVAGGAGRTGQPWTAGVARYARGRDYHDVLRSAIKGVVAGMKELRPALQARVSCDSGPYLEREYAWLAGLGFFGRNTCLIHERLGSGLFLGVAVTNLVLDGAPDTAEPQAEPLYAAVPRRLRVHKAYLTACGSCTRCLDACPTGALDPELGLDASACISTGTIEKRGQVPEHSRSATRGILFGCDICQTVCPWNQRAAGRDLPPVDAAYGTMPEHAERGLADLAVMEDEEFRRRFRRTPLWRCHPEGLRRNAQRLLEEKS